MPEQEVHEIQLNGKQLVFMFMAATVVSVVIFLCGVMVGRGVRQPVTTLTLNPETAVDPTTQIESATSAPAPTGDSTAAPVQENLTYAERLESVSAPDDTFKPPPPAEKPQVAPAIAEPAPTKVVAARETSSAKRAVPEKAAATTQPTVQRAKFVEPGSKGYAVQVMAFVTPGEAEALAARLQKKGYPAFVTRTDGAAPAKYRVRVGKYDKLSDAQAIFQRLKREEHFAPWLPPR
jgi:cell division protein FtsN